MSTLGGCHEYIRREGEYHEYIEGYSVHWRVLKIHVEDIMSTLEDVEYIGGYHGYVGDIIIDMGEIIINAFNLYCAPHDHNHDTFHMNHDTLRLTEHPQCTHYILPHIHHILR